MTKRHLDWAKQHDWGHSAYLDSDVLRVYDADDGVWRAFRRFGALRCASVRFVRGPDTEEG